MIILKKIHNRIQKYIKNKLDFKIFRVDSKNLPKIRRQVIILLLLGGVLVGFSILADKINRRADNTKNWIQIETRFTSCYKKTAREGETILVLNIAHLDYPIRYKEPRNYLDPIFKSCIDRDLISVFLYHNTFFGADSFWITQLYSHSQNRLVFSRDIAHKYYKIQEISWYAFYVFIFVGFFFGIIGYFLYFDEWK